MAKSKCGASELAVHIQFVEQALTEIKGDLKEMRGYKSHISVLKVVTTMLTGWLTWLTIRILK